MRILIYLLVLLNINTSIGQQNLPLMFKNNPNNWSMLNWIEGSKKDNQKFKNRLPPFVVEDTIYLFSNYQGLNETGFSYGYNGFSIKKVNKITGQRYWELIRTYKSFSNRKAISQSQLDGNILKVTLFDEGSPGSGGSDWSNCYPAHISIDINNGLVIDSSFVDYSDPTVPKFQSIAGSQGESIITNPRFYTTEDGYLQREFSTGNLGFIDTKTTIDGKILNKDTTKIYFNYSPDDFRYFDNADGTVGALMVSKTFNWTKREMKYLKYDKSLNLIDSSDLSMNFTDTITVFNFYRADNGYMITVTTFDDFSIRTSKYTYHLFDADGNLVDKLIYYLREGEDNGIVYGWLYPMVDIVNKRLILTHSRQNKLSESTYFELFASDGDTIQRVKRIEVEGIKDHFVTQYATMLENGDILLYVEQFAQNDPSSPRWYSWINLDGQEMNIISSTKDEQSIFNKLKLYPNPNTGIVKIDHLETSASITITNINGQTLKTLHNVQNELDISELPQGMYIFDIRNKEISERHKIVKVE